MIATLGYKEAEHLLSDQEQCGTLLHSSSTGVMTNLDLLAIRSDELDEQRDKDKLYNRSRGTRAAQQLVGTARHLVARQIMRRDNDSGHSSKGPKSLRQQVESRALEDRTVKNQLTELDRICEVLASATNIELKWDHSFPTQLEKVMSACLDMNNVFLDHRVDRLQILNLELAKIADQAAQEEVLRLVSAERVSLNATPALM